MEFCCGRWVGLVLSTFTLVLNLMAFASAHSLIASLSFKRLIVRVLGSWADVLYLPVYSLIAVLTISPLVYLLYKNPGRLLYRIPSPWRWLMVGGQVIASIATSQSFAGRISQVQDSLTVIWTKGS